jgi:hypothetical protein
MMKDGTIGKLSNDMVTISSFGSFHPSDFRKLGDVIKPRREKVLPSQFPNSKAKPPATPGRIEKAML